MVDPAFLPSFDFISKLLCLDIIVETLKEEKKKKQVKNPKQFYEIQRSDLWFSLGFLFVWLGFFNFWVCLVLWVLSFF